MRTLPSTKPPTMLPSNRSRSPYAAARMKTARTRDGSRSGSLLAGCRLGGRWRCWSWCGCCWSSPLHGRRCRLAGATWQEDTRLRGASRPAGSTGRATQRSLRPGPGLPASGRAGPTSAPVACCLPWQWPLPPGLARPDPPHRHPWRGRSAGGGSRCAAGAARAPHLRCSRCDPRAAAGGRGAG
jgi:hypothetical protein